MNRDDLDIIEVLGEMAWREEIELAKKRITIAQNINRHYDDDFSGSPTIDIRLPRRFTAYPRLEGE